MIIAIKVIIALGVVIFFHELGHFIVAKLRGVKVLKFSLGFGPKLIGVKKGDTEYVISALPFGGYVKMAGEDLKEGNLIGEKWEFFGQPWWSRILIVVVGPIMNFALAVITFIFIFWYGIDFPTYSTQVGSVEVGSNAEKSGFKPFDKIVSVDAKLVSSWYEFEKYVFERSQFKEKGLSYFVVKVLREDKELEIKSEVSEKGMAGLEPNILPIIDSVNPGSPAYKSGLKCGDEILAVNNKPISQWLEFQKVVLTCGGKELSLKIKRLEAIIFKNVVPVKDNILTKRFLIGISPKTNLFYKERLGVVESIKNGFEKVYFLTVLQLKAIYMIITNKVSAKDSLGGPVMVIQVASSAAQKGLIDFLGFFAFINASLGLVNLLPIPLVDGGYILVFLIEGIRRKPLSVKYMQIFQQIGLFIIISIAVLVTYNDVLRILSRLWSN
ncbi:MAG: RIP metalloprotease RseP [Candidatus Firestonebacteria bacterium]